MSTPSITVLAPGTFIASDGQAFTFGLRELENIARDYDPKSDPAPLVVGTPDLTDPAYGWVSSLYVEGGQLKARVDKLDASFGEMVRAGNFPKVVARFYLPGANGNPKPGSWYLRHVAFNGTARPAIHSGQQSFGQGSDFGTIGLDSTASPYAAHLVAQSKYTASSGRRHVLNGYDVYDRAAVIRRKCPEMAMAAAVQMAVDEIDAEQVPDGEDHASLSPLNLEQINLRLATTLRAKNPALSMTDALEIARIANGGELALPKGYSADPARAALYVAVMKRRADDPALSFAQALQSVS